MYIHINKRAAKRTPAPSLHKDSNLGVPTSSLRFYLRGEQRGMVGKRMEADKPVWDTTNLMIHSNKTSCNQKMDEG